MSRKLAELQEEAEPVLHVPRRGDAFAVECMKLMQTETDLFAGRRDAEQFALMRAADFGAHGDLAGHLNQVVNDDAHVGKGFAETADDRLDAFRAATLAGRERNVVPIRGKNRIDEVGVLVAEGAVQRLTAARLMQRRSASSDAAAFMDGLSKVVGSGESVQFAIKSVQQIAV
ncbi:MAG: unnamed protein product [uncultured Paraburkholderia sp.]|nr:MAG: unnamed protein product [uncultured Paraburkholderia sp.]CAH2940529.1 MAG: unnamed protein product [uncultured Paraburkholderia sp.]